MRISQDIRELAKNKGIRLESVINEGLREKADEFIKSGSEIYK